MKKIIDGLEYKNLVDYGLRNLFLNKDKINELNVFPVPDGDTGTNMVMTLQNGYSAIKDCDNNLSSISQRFANAIVFGARGNSGVITSQFFRGISECFFQLSEADPAVFASALQNGVDKAYKSVSTPAEGTLLTVVREATDGVCFDLKNGKIQTFNELVSSFLEKARASLDNTPELLPILKSAGVVDSGGAGIVCIFEGMHKYLNGEWIAQAEDDSSNSDSIDYSLFNENSEFNLGYCTELLIQLTKNKNSFDYDMFKQELSSLGESIVIYYENGKVKLHIHTNSPENVLASCHKYGEFLSLKIENMSVQHHDKESKKSSNVYSEQPKGKFSVLVVAYDEQMKEKFSEMGADLVILGDRLCPPSAADFITAFNKTNGPILVFANGKNASLSAKQAVSLYDKSKIVIIETKSDTECYSALPMIDFDNENIEVVAETIRETISNIKTVTISSSIKQTIFNGENINVGQLVAFSDKEVLALGNNYKEVAIKAINTIMTKNERDVITMFVNKKISTITLDEIKEYVSQFYMYTEVYVVETNDSVFDIILSFE